MKVLKGIGAGCNEEAARVTNMITWFPGEVDGKIADVEMVLPFDFKL